MFARTAQHKKPRKPLSKPGLIERNSVCHEHMKLALIPYLVTMLSH